MWPWGHLAVGYLLYSVFTHLRERRPPDRVAAIALALGTQFPDLVDKPLAWTLGIIPNGRSLTHSFLVAVVLVAVLEVVLRRRDYGAVATAFGIGYLSHLFGDALYPLLTGDYYLISFLAWPLVPAIEYSTEQSFAAHLRKLTLESFVSFEVALGLLVIILWLTDGAPGFRIVGAIPKWVGRKISF